MAGLVGMSVLADVNSFIMDTPSPKNSPSRTPPALIGKKHGSERWFVI